MWVCIMSKSCQFGGPIIITAHKPSCRKVMFLHLPVSHSVHRGSDVSLTKTSLDTYLWIETPWTKTPRQRPHWTDTPLGQRTPWKETPRMVKNGSYASYWNAFLLLLLLLCFVYDRNAIDRN